MIRGNFEAGFLSAYQYKDLRIATHAGDVYRASMPITELTTEQYKSIVETGMVRDDNSRVSQVLERLAGTKARIDEAQ
jgi:3-hydroxyisobutyrate dehydrogenase-like beta-hydroxyacid dehydrogenase